MCITALWIFARELHRRGIAVTVFALHYPYRKEPYVWHGIPVIPLNGRNRFLQRKVIIPIKLKRLFRKQHQAHPFTHIHSFWLGEATYCGIRLSKKHRLPLVATAMGQDVLAENNYLERIDRKALKALVTLSVFQQEHLQETTRWPSMVIPFGLPETEPVTTAKTVDVIGIGNLIQLKNYAYFIEICNRLVQQRPDFRAEIIGVGPEQERLQQQIDRLGLTRHVKLTGGCYYEETQQRLAAAKVLLHPSTYESFGMVLIEALALQTHVVANTVGAACDHASMHTLSGNVVNDSAMIAGLLVSPPPEPEVYTVAATGDRYLEVYTS